MALYDNWTWDAVNKIMTIVADDVRGGSEGNPFSFEDIQDCITAKGWTVDWTEGCELKQFCCGFRIVIGDGSTTTWFVDTAKTLVFLSTAVSAHWRHLIERKAQAHVRFGRVLDVTKKSTDQGVHILDNTNYISSLYKGNPNGEDFLYSCSFQKVNPVDGYDGRLTSLYGRLWNGILDRVFMSSTSNVDTYNIIFLKSTYAYGCLNYGLAGTFERLIILECNRVIYPYSNQPLSISDVLVKKINNQFAYCLDTTVDSIVKDVESPSWVMTWAGSGSQTGKVIRSYTYDPVVTDGNNNPIENSVVKIEEKVGAGGSWTTLWEKVTGSDGKLVDGPQTITHKTYEWDSGYTRPTTQTIETEYFHRVTVTKTGYATYGPVDITIDHKIENDQIALDALTYGYDDVMKKIRHLEQEMVAGIFT